MNAGKKIPTLLGIVLIIILAVAVSWIFQIVTSGLSFASETLPPTSVAITNITDSSFSFIWLTSKPATGQIKISAQGKTTLVGDERDTESKIGKFTSHSITARNLAPDTTYAVVIYSGGKAFSNENKPYAVTTGPTLTSSSGKFEPAFGMVLTATNQPAGGALVYLTLDGAQTLSALVKPSGSWLIPLNLIRTSSLSGYLPSADRINETISVLAGEEEASAISDTLNDSPVPTMILGKSYDFRKQQAAVPIPPPLAQAAVPAGGTVLGAQIKTSGKITIQQPANGAALSTNLPIFEGTGVPGKIVSLTIGITHPFADTTTVGTDGIWRYTPTQPLSLGKQGITITTVDKTGKTVALTNVFEILKSGSQVLGIATPSATLTPTPTTIIAIASSSPVPTSTLAGQPPPETGTITPTVILLFLGLALMSGGIFAFIK